MTTTQELAFGSPEEVGMSAERLKKIDVFVQEYIDAGRIQGVVIGVTRRNKVVYMEAHGVIDELTQRPMRKDLMFHMVSSTKPVLGVAAMMMIEEGLISPEDPVEKYIPEFKGIQVAVSMNPEQARDGRMAGAFGWGGAAGTVSRTTPGEESDGRVHGSATDRFTLENRRSGQGCY